MTWPSLDPNLLPFALTGVLVIVVVALLIGIAVLLAERRNKPPAEPIRRRPPITPISGSLLSVRDLGSSVPFLGRYLVEQGVLSMADLESALARQQQLARLGRPARLGDVLVDLKLASREQVEAALKAQQEEFQARF
ncbi:MAG: hypothetical protein K6U89_20005 [Chloroflexi bacterium]|nr:hypothetical protein [Chloroflexota bacterium]